MHCHACVSVFLFIQFTSYVLSYLISVLQMRENSLLCLMYALITFPSTEFNINEITEILIKHGISEQKRRVRQALLDTLSILGQLVPKSKLKIDSTDEAAIAFKRAIRARLTRRQLPTVSQSGLIFYAFEVSPTTVFGTWNNIFFEKVQ